MAEHDDDGGGSAPAVHHAPPHGGAGIKGKLSRRVGPLPVWGWAMVGTGGVVAFWLLLHRKGGAGGSGSGVGAALPADPGPGVGIGGGAGDPTGGGVITHPGSTPVDRTPDPQWWNTATKANPILRDGYFAFDPANPFKAGTPGNMPDWLVGGAHYPGEVAPGVPPGYVLKPGVGNQAGGYDPYDPNNYVPASSGGAHILPVPSAIHDNTMTDNNPGASHAIFVPPAVIDGRPTTAAERAAAMAAHFGNN